MTARQGVLLIFVMTVAAYAMSLGAPLIYEDRNILPWATTWSWRAVLANRGGQNVTYWLTGQSSALWVAHAFGIAIHLINGWLVWKIASWLMSEESAVWAVAMSCLAPIQTESVAYLAGRGDVLFGAAALSAIWITLTTTTWTWGRMVGLVASVLAAMWVKDVGVVVVPIVAWTAICRWPRRLGWLSWTIMGVGVLAVTGGMYWVVWHSQALQTRAAISDHSLVEYVGLQSAAWWRYLWAVVWPAGLSIDHDFEAWMGVTLLAFAGVAAYAFQAIHYRRTVIGWAFGAALLAVLPRFVIRQDELLHEHHMYLSVCLLSLALAAAIPRVGHAKTA